MARPANECNEGPTQVLSSEHTGAQPESLVLTVCLFIGSSVGLLAGPAALISSRSEPVQGELTARL